MTKDENNVLQHSKHKHSKTSINTSSDKKSKSEILVERFGVSENVSSSKKISDLLEKKSGQKPEMSASTPPVKSSPTSKTDFLKNGSADVPSGNNSTKLNQIFNNHNTTIDPLENSNWVTIHTRNQKNATTQNETKLSSQGSSLTASPKRRQQQYQQQGTNLDFSDITSKNTAVSALSSTSSIQNGSTTVLDQLGNIQSLLGENPDLNRKNQKHAANSIITADMDSAATHADIPKNKSLAESLDSSSVLDLENADSHPDMMQNQNHANNDLSDFRNLFDDEDSDFSSDSDSDSSDSDIPDFNMHDSGGGDSDDSDSEMNDSGNQVLSSNNSNDRDSDGSNPDDSDLENEHLDVVPQKRKRDLALKIAFEILKGLKWVLIYMSRFISTTLKTALVIILVISFGVLGAGIGAIYAYIQDVEPITPDVQEIKILTSYIRCNWLNVRILIS